MKIYLAGPISGHTYKEVTTWRDDIAKQVEALGHSVFNPMVSVNHLKDEDEVMFSYENHFMLKSEHIFQADLYKIRQSDVLLCNLQNLKKHTIGSFFEIGYAYALNKIVIVIATDKMITEHPFIKNAAIIASSIDEAIKALSELAR